MTITKDHSDMPKADSRAWPPDATPRFGHRLAEAWAEHAQVDAPYKTRGKLMVSGAGQCARMTGYRALGIPKTEPTTLSDYWRMGLGSMVHSLLEPVMAKAFPGADIEFDIDYRDHEQYPLDMTGHGDVCLTTVVTDDEPTPRTIVIEWKTVNGFGAKLMVGARKGFGGADGSGPKPNQVVQAALEGFARDADEVVLAYLFLECLSEREAKKLGTDDIGKFIAEFTLTREVYEPIAHAELKRLTNIMSFVDKEELPPRQIPGVGHPKARIVDPSTGRWELRSPDGATTLDSGETWHCGYCDWRSQCIKDSAS